MGDGDGHRAGRQHFPAFTSDAHPLTHDGKASLQEYFAGTDPQDPQSRLEFTRIALVGGRTELEFSAVSNHTYSIEYRSAGDAAGTAWQVLADVAARVSNHVAAVTDELGGNQRLYRVVTPRKP